MDGEVRRCQHTKPDGEPCQATPRAGRDWCFHHDPDSRLERHAARSRGGLACHQPPVVLSSDEPDADLSTVPNVVAYLGRIANATAKGALEPKVCNAVVLAVATLLRALQPTDETRRQLEQQLDELRRKVTAHDDLFERVSRAASVLRQLREQPDDCGPDPAEGCGERGVPPGPLPRVGPGQLLVAPEADGPAGPVPVPDVR